MLCVDLSCIRSVDWVECSAIYDVVGEGAVFSPIHLQWLAGQ